MDYTQALGWIEEQENGKDVAEAIRLHVGGINKEAQSWRQKYKGAEGDSKTATEELDRLRNEVDKLKSDIKTLQATESTLKSEATELQKQLQQAKTDLETEKNKVTTTEASLTAAQSQVKELETKITETTAKLTGLETDKTALQRSLTLTEVATTAGAQLNVLKTLVKDDQQLVIENGQAFVQQGETKTDLREFADANWKEFVPALFPSSPGNRLPDGSPKGTEGQKGPSKVNKTLGNIYGKPEVKN